MDLSGEWNEETQFLRKDRLHLNIGFLRLALETCFEGAVIGKTWHARPMARLEFPDLGIASAGNSQVGRPRDRALGGRVARWCPRGLEGIRK